MGFRLLGRRIAVVPDKPQLDSSTGVAKAFNQLPEELGITVDTRVVFRSGVGNFAIVGGVMYLILDIDDIIGVVE
jgi:co-chaperonin GroES (HSP10)